MSIYQPTTNLSNISVTGLNCNQIITDTFVMNDMQISQQPYVYTTTGRINTVSGQSAMDVMIGKHDNAINHRYIIGIGNTIDDSFRDKTLDTQVMVVGNGNSILCDAYSTKILMLGHDNTIESDVPGFNGIVIGNNITINSSIWDGNNAIYYGSSVTPVPTGTFGTPTPDYYIPVNMSGIGYYNIPIMYNT